MEQQIRFCTTSDNVRIAYSTVGEGSPLIWAYSWVTHLEVDWSNPASRSFLESLAQNHLLIRFDKRGTGLSDRDVTDISRSARLLDMEAVVEAVGVDRFALIGESESGPTAIEYAVRNPSRVSHLILYGSFHRWRPPEKVIRPLIALIRSQWGMGSAALASSFVPSGEPTKVAFFTELQKRAASGEMAARMFEENLGLDITHLLSEVRSPTLVVHRRDDQSVPVELGREMASLIPGARLVTLEGDVHPPYWGDTRKILDVIEEFLGDVEETATEERQAEPLAPTPPAAAVRRKGARLRDPRIQYAKTEDGVNIAYWTMGEGEPLVHVPLPFSHIQMELQIPEMRRWYEGLAREHTLVRYDHRGFGLSDRTTVDLSLPTQVGDLEALIEKLGFETFALFGPLLMGPIAIEYAARHPEKVSHLILWCSWASYSDYLRSPRTRALVALRDQDWETYTEAVAHTMLGWAEGEPSSRYAALMRESVSAEAVRDGLERKGDKLDVTARLERVKSPTLVLHRREVVFVDVEVARGLASRIPDAQLALLEGDSAAPFLGDTQSVLDAIGDFMNEGAEASAAEQKAEPPVQPAPAAAVRRKRAGPMEPRIQYAQTKDGVSIAWGEAGDGPALLSCGPTPFTHVQEYFAITEAYFGTLARSFRLITFDARGTGLSEHDVKEVSAATLLMDAEAVIDAAKLDRFAVEAEAPLLPIATALHLATTLPERVTHLILESPFQNIEELADTPYGRVTSALAQADWPVYTQTLFRVLLGWDSSNVLADQMANAVAEWVDPSIGRQYVEAEQDVDVSDLLAGVLQPTLVVRNVQHAIPARFSQRVAANIPGAQFRQYSDPTYGQQAELIRAFIGQSSSVSPAPSEDATQTRISSPPEAKTFASGRYVVQRLLGQGAQKSVYLVDDTTLERECALSVLNPTLLDPSDVDRIKREAQTMAKFGSQPNIVTVYDYGEEDGTPFIVCEYVSGGDLRDELAAAAGPLSLERALAVAMDICRALSFAHGRDIVHRDLKPENVWLTEERTAKLGDFGIALSLGRTRLTMAGGITGTATYMAPEQVSGGDVDARSDLYAFGVLLYELVTGQPPFMGDDPNSIMYQHVNTKPESPLQHNEAVPPGLERLIMRLLAKTKAERPSSAEEVLAELERA